ncbi:MAG: right-handed parallel beta-helix repeat-containing protein, partial [Pyrinomonadaceae bacterium]
GYNDAALYASTNKNTSGVLHNWAAVSGGYTMELAIPWSKLGVTPTANMTIGFGVNDDDNDSARDAQIMWNGTSSNYQNTSAFGHAVLVAASDVIPPSTPTSLTATAASSSQIDLSWNASTDNIGATGYKIYRGGAQIATTTGTSYSNTGLSPSITYSYVVTAYDALGNTTGQSPSVSATTQAAPDRAAPSAPTNLIANAVSPSQINLAWTSSTDNVGVTGYKVYRAGTQITTVSGTAYRNTGLSPSTAYSYTVAAYDAARNTSAQASSVLATTQALPTTTLSITSYGATGNDTTDDTAAINDTINAAKAQGRGVYVPAGTFHHTNFTLDSVTMAGDGDVSVLVATNKAHSSIVLIGNSPAITSVKLTSPNAVVRDTTPWSTGVEVRAATNFTVGDVTVTRIGSAGIFTWQGSGPGKVVNNRVLDTLADAIHFTDKSHDIIAANNYVRGAGDDMVAIVSYLSDGAQVRNVLVQDNVVADQNWGRGVTVVGGKDVTIQRNKVARTNHGAGIMVAAENFWNTYGNDNILISDNTLTDISGPDTHQGAILMFVDPGQGANTRVRVENNTVTNARYDGIKVDGNNQDISIV